MHDAPAVNFPVGRTRAAAWLLAGFWMAGAAAWVGWCVFAASPLDWRHAVGVCSVLCAGAFALRHWVTLRTAVLAWNGQEWSLQPAGAQRAMAHGQVQVHLDLQSHLLLRLHAPGGDARWLWAERRAAPAQWDALRRAVHASAGTAGPGMAAA